MPWSSATPLRIKSQCARQSALKQRDFVTKKLILPFLTVMKAYNNPGIEFLDDFGPGWDLSTDGEAMVFKVGLNSRWYYAIYLELSSKPYVLSHNKAEKLPFNQEHVDFIRSTLRETLMLHNLPVSSF